MRQSISYRRDIDGLRALAIISVVFYHYGVPGFGGGFTGVDIFFVISGFLIGGHIAAEIDAGRFSLVAFYERRIRRIFPALYAMFAVVLFLAVFVLFPPDLALFGQLAPYVIPFAANVELYRSTGAYGGEFTNHIVLLHTWSLAVEEQFYLFFPLLMIAIARYFGHRYTAVLTSIALLSLCACVVAARVAPLADFYLAPFRAWELLLGALVAVRAPSPPKRTLSRNLLAVAGLALMSIAAVFLNASAPFPSELALAPCIGCALVIIGKCDGRTGAGKILANPVMRWIGLRSYSIYLIHWPLWVLAQYYAFDPLSYRQRAVLLVAVLGLAELSWRCVEQPFRGRHGLFRRPVLLSTATGVGSMLLIAALGLRAFTESPGAMSAERRAIFPDFKATETRCPAGSPNGARFCILGDRSVAPSTILWGDSHALAMLPAVDTAFAAHREAIVLTWLGACLPLPGVSTRTPHQADLAIIFSALMKAGVGRSAACARHTERVLDWLGSHHITTVILAGYWNYYLDPRFQRLLTDDDSPGNPTLRDNPAVFKRGIARLLLALRSRHIRVFVLNDAPEIDVPVPFEPLGVPYALASAIRLGDNREFGITRDAYDRQQKNATEAFASLQHKYAFTILRTQDPLCAGGFCVAARLHTSLYADDQHLSTAGAIVARSALQPIWQN